MISDQVCVCALHKRHLVMLRWASHPRCQEHKGTLKQVNWWDWDLDQDKLDDDEYGDEYVDALIALALEVRDAPQISRLALDPSCPKTLLLCDSEM